MILGPNNKIYASCFTGQSSLRVIEQAANGTFESSTLLLLPSFCPMFLVTEDEELIVTAMGTSIAIFKKGASNYTLEQTLGGSAIKGLALSADQLELVSCLWTLQVHRHNGTQFVLNQTIDLGFQCFEVNFLSNLLEVHGFSSQLRFYEFNGSAYVPKFTLTTDEFKILELNIFENGTKFTFGSDSQKISTYTFDDGSFQLSEQLETGVAIYKMFIDPN